MSVRSGGRYSFLTVLQITHLVMTESPKGKGGHRCNIFSSYMSLIHIPCWLFIFFCPSLSLSLPLSSTTPSICERVTPRLSHANSAVVLSAVKVLMKFMEMLPKDLDYYGTLLKKLAPPLVTLLSAEPELQYVALRNINLIVQRR